MLDSLRSRGLSPARLVMAVVLSVLTAAAAASGGLDVPSAVLLVAGIVFFAASAVRRVREHAAWNVAENAVVFVWGLALFVADSDPAALALLLVVVGLFSVAVETYNYRYGTSYGRISLSE